MKALADLLESSIRPHIIWHCLNQAILKGRGHDYVRFTWNLIRVIFLCTTQRTKDTIEIITGMYQYVSNSR